MTGIYILPTLIDTDTAGFFEAAREGRLVVRRCLDCGSPLHLPRAYCKYCQSWNTDWVTMSGRGRLYSWTTMERPVHPAFLTPYTAVVVELEDAPEVRLCGMIEGLPELQAGCDMIVWFQRLTDEVTLPQWRVA